MSDSDSDFIDIEVKAERAIANLKKSKKSYEKAYKDFKDWCVQKKVGDTITENVLLEYFAKLLESSKGPAVWSTYAKLRATFNVMENIDIKNFVKLRAHLKNRCKGEQPKSSEILTRKQIYQFLQDAPDEHYLGMKVTITNLLILMHR